MEDCVFCRIAAKQIPAKIVYESDGVIAFPDHTPSAPIHLLIVPKKHIPTTMDIADQDAHLVLEMIKAIQSLVRDRGLQKTNYRIAVNGGSFLHVSHLHWHLLSWPHKS